MADRSVNVRTAWGLVGIALTLFVLPLLINVMRGGVRGVGRDPRTQGSDMRFAVTYPVEVAPGPLSGRFFLIVSRSAEPEPRLQLTSGTGQTYVFRRNVVAWKPSTPFELTDADPGSPLPSIAYIPAGYYWVQGIFEPDGGGEGTPDTSSDPFGGDWATHAGNLVSRPVELSVDPRGEDVLRVHLARRIVGVPATP